MTRSAESRGAGQQPWEVPPGSGSRAGAQRVVLTEASGPHGARQPVRMRRIVTPILVAAVVLACAVAGGGWLVGRRIAEQQAVHDVAELTDVLAEAVVQPVLTDAMITDPVGTRRTLDPVVHSRVLSGQLVRVKLWGADGTILYADQPALIGKRFPLDDDALAALRAPRIAADVTDLRRPENQLERSQGKLLEVYRPVWTPRGQRLLFETYFRYDAVDSRSRQLWQGFGGVMLSSLAALLVLLVPLAWALLKRARDARAHRELLMRRALEASDDERRRIAATLHDGVVQQLAAASFSVSGAARQAASDGYACSADLDAAAGTIRDGLAGLRSLLVDIYPPALHSAGLAAALRDLARTTTGGRATVTTEIDERTADDLPEQAQEAVFRIAQEALRNATTHADARHVRICLRTEATGPVLAVDDDGRGVDTDVLRAGGREGHFGLRLMTDAAQGIGARLAVISAPGAGTTVSLEMAP